MDSKNKLHLDVNKKTPESENDETGSVQDGEFQDGDVSPAIQTTTNFNPNPNQPPIHICCYRSRHVQLCGRSNSIGKILKFIIL